MSEQTVFFYENAHLRGARFFPRIKLAFQIFWNVLRNRTVMYRFGASPTADGRVMVATTEKAIAAFVDPA